MSIFQLFRSVAGIFHVLQMAIKVMSSLGIGTGEIPHVIDDPLYNRCAHRSRWHEPISSFDQGRTLLPGYRPLPSRRRL